MIDEVLQKLIEFVENASPVLWEILIKQVYVEAFAKFACVLMWAIIAIFLYKLAKYCMKKYTNDEYNGWDVGAYFSYGGAAIAAIVAFGTLISAVMYLINPEFYAIRYILQQISGG